MWRGSSVQPCNSMQHITTEDFDDEIGKSTNLGISLESTITKLERLFHRKLGKYDLYYVEDKYVELQINNYLLEQVPDKITKTINVNTLLEFINKLNTLKNLDECCDFISEFLKENENKQLKALKQLCATSNKVKLHEKQYIKEFIRKCFTIVHLKADYVSGEIDFNKCLTELLKSTKNPAELCKSLGLLPEVVKEFENDLCFKEFMSKLSSNCTFNNKHVYKLQHCAKLIINQDNFLLNKDIKTTIESYLKKPTLKEVNGDGRFFLEISGKHIVISNVLEEIEKKLKNSHLIEEVRFVNAGVVHIDKNLSASTWQGKNLVVYTETAIVSDDKKVTWDVSGKDAESTDWTDAGTGDDGIGLSGADGQPGESGGNVLFIVGELKNAQNLKIRSNGGNGGKGQDGGIGIDGRDGVFLEEKMFKDIFPPAAKLLDSKKSKHLEHTKETLLMMFESVQNFFYGQSFMVGTISKMEFEKYLSDCISSMLNIYCELKTNKGCKITFSFYYGDIATGCQALLLHEGSLGEEGKSGGSGGQGGKGGSAGEIKIQVDDSAHLDVSLSRALGNKGNPGKTGMDGNPGKKGVDRGYTDYSRDVFQKWPKYFIPDLNDNIRLHINYSTETNSERVFCAHNDLFAEIVQKPIVLTRHHRYRENTNEITSNYEGHTRKKAIIEDSIRNQYEQKLCNTDSFKLNSFLEKVKDSVLELLMDTSLQTEQITTELKVVRQISYSNENPHILVHQNDSNSNRVKKEEQHDNIKNVSATELVKLITDDPGNLRIWKQLSQTRLTIIQLQELWNIIDKISLEEDLYQHINIVFCNKYQLATLECLAQNLENSCCVSDLRPNEYMLKYFDKLLTITEEEEYIGIEEYFLRDSSEKREEALDLFNEKLDSVTTNRKVINNTLLVFLYEFSCNPIVKKTLEEVQEFEKTKEQKLAVKLIALKSALTRSKTKSIYNAFIESIVKKTNQEKITFENEIQKDNFFYLMYESYVKSTKHTFNWEMLLNSDDHEIVQFLLDTVMQNGPFCAFYREFLAYHFEKNIMVYTRNEKNETMLAHNHNPTACTTVHFLLKEKEFIKLRVDNELVEMVCSQKTQGALLNNILIHVDTCSDKNQLDELISKNPTWVLSGSCNDFEKSDRIRVRIAHIMMEENNIKGVLNAYNIEKDKEVIKYRLGKLKFQYTGCESILYYLALHFNCEGAHISAEELCLLINFILKCALKMPHTIPLLSWIVAAYPQEQWLVEVILLKFDLNFSSSVLNPVIKSKWRQYLHEQKDRQMLMLMLKKITDKNTPASVEKIEETLYLLSGIPAGHAWLKKLDFDDWTYYLKEKFWFYQLKLIADWSNDQLETASYYMVVLENTVGMSLCKNLINVLKSHKLDLASESTRELVTNYLRIFTNQEVCLNDDLLDDLKYIQLSEWKGEIDKTYFSSSEDRTLAEILEIVKNNRSASDNVSSKLNVITQAIELSDKIKVTLEKMEYSKFKEWISQVFLVSGDETKSVLEKIKEYLKLPITDEMLITLGKNIFLHIFCKSTISEVDTLLKSDEDFMEASLIREKSLSVAFAAVVEAVERELKFTIRDTQKLAIMTLLKSNGNLLSQVSTGEGKSIIIVIVAIIKALNGQKVDIVTSSHVLAERDANKYKNVYNLFGVNVDHNYSENIEIRKKVYSNNNVVYGELANFQRDFLLHEIYNKNVLGDRKLSSQIIIVDEVDSMLLDRGNNTLYLSHEIPGLDKLEEVFIYIWFSLNTLSGQPNLKSSVIQLKYNILNEIFGFVTKDDLKNLDTDLDSNQVNQIYNLLVKNGIISSTGKLLVKDCLLASIPETCLKKDHIWYLLKKILERKKKITIPNYLNQFVETHLEEWIKSGIRAMSMEPGVDYVVDVDRSETSGDTSPNITIIDRDTGTDLINSQWEDGLHQFLQLKHGCRLSIISLKAVFISNVSYLKKYKTLFGLTGTIGSTKEQHLLREIYDIDFIMIPTAKTKLFTEEKSVLCTSTDEWTTTIWENVSKKIRQNRSVLIICETVRDVNIIKQKFDQVFSFHHVISPSKISIYKRDYEKLIVADGLKPSHVIISTNLAGRGTDIKLSEELINVGGLHVCLSFLPSNSRVEEQAYGRAARNGQPGSAQMIFRNSAHEITSSTTVIDLKKQRDVGEVIRIADIKSFNTIHVQPQERCFEEFRNLYEQIDSLQHEENIKKILLQVSLDKWAFWLEKNKGSLDLKSSTSFIEEINSLCSKDYVICIEDPSQLSKLGLLLIDSNKYDQAIMLFDRVIKDEPSFSENARYYRMCAKMVKKDLTSEDIITEANLIVKLLKERIQSLLISANIIDQLKKRDHMNILQVESFKEQHINICKTYEVFLENIYSIIGYGFDAQSLALPPLIDDECASRIYNDLMRKNIISGPQMKKNISGADLEFVALYGLIPNEFMCFLNFYNTRNSVLDEGKLLKMLKQHCSVPSRELFWKQLLRKKILIDEEKYSIVNVQKLKIVDPSLSLVIDSLKITNKLEEDNQIWLYQLEDIDCFDEKEFVLTKKANLKKEIGAYKYRLLKHKYVVHPNKQATLLKLHNNIKFDSFDCLMIEDFYRVNISSEIALDIIHELEEKHVILKIDENRYCLSVEPRDIGSVKLSRFKAYTDEVVNLLTICFAFRLALHKTWDSMHNQTIKDDSICLPLQIRLEKRILEDLYEHGIVEKSVIKPNKEKQIPETLKSLYPKKWTKEELDLIFSDLFELSTTRSNIIDCLIENNWLSEVKQYNLKNIKQCNLKNIFSDKEYSFQQEQLKELPELPSAVEKYTETIKLVLKRHSSLSEPYHHLHVKNFVYQHASSISGIATPSLSLVHLSDVINERKMPLRECTIFSLNGFDKLIILEELKYSRKMIISTFVVALLGVVEITVGAVYGSPKFVEQGLGDLEYVISCILSGHFSWNDYSSQKITNVILSVGSFTTSGKFGTSFGQKLSLSSTWNVSQRTIVKSIAKEIVRHSVTTCAVAASHAAIDNVIEPKLAELGSILVELSTSNIDSIVDEHPVVESIQRLHLQLGKEKTTTLTKLYSCKVMEDYKSQDDKDLLLLFGKLHVNIISCINSYINMKTISFIDLLSLLSSVNDIIEGISELITYSGFLKEIQLLTIANEMTDSLQDLLGKNVNDERTGSQLEIPENGDAEVFLNEILVSWKQGIKNVYIYNINKRIIHPLMICLKNRLTASLSHTSTKKFVFYPKDEDLSEIKLGEQFKISEGFNNSGNLKDYEAFICMEYDDCLIDLFVKTQSASIFLEILRTSYTADISFIKHFCSVIPTALKTQGLNLPMLQIVIESDSVQTISDGVVTPESDVLTLNIVPNENFLENLKRNKIVIQHIFDALHKSIVQLHPKFKKYNGWYIRNLVAKAIEEDNSILQHICSDCSIEPRNDVCNTSFEEHNSESLGRRVSLQYSDRKEGVCSAIDQFQQSDKIKKCVIKGFKTALEKINNHIYLSHPYLIHFKLTLEEFIEVQHEVIPSKQFSVCYFDCYATRYELVIPLEHQVNSLLVDYKVTMSLISTTDITKFHRPNGPHIVYKINPVDISSNAFLVKEGFEGFVTLDFEYEDTVYSVKDCHSAGELVLPILS